MNRQYSGREVDDPVRACIYLNTSSTVHLQLESTLIGHSVYLLMQK